MFIHKEIIFVLTFVLILLGMMLILFLLDFFKFRKIISEYQQNLKNSFFFFHQYEPIVYSLNQIHNLSQQEIKKKEATLKFFQNFFFNFPDPLIIINSQYEIIELNKSAFELIDKESIGRNIYLASRMYGLEELLKKLFKSKEFGIGQLRTLDPPEKFFNAWASFFRRGKDNQILLRLYNSTGEEKFQSLQRDFVANASHELRTPISAIIGCCETLLGVGKSDNEIRKKFLKTIKNESVRMKSLVDDLLSLLHIERVEHSYPDGQINVKELFDDIEQLISKTNPYKKNKIKFYRPILNLNIPGDYNEIKQVMLNIIDNALKYGISEKKIDVKMSKKSDLVEFSVTDYGHGIDQKNIPLLTNRFYRVDDSRSRHAGSTGLGLSIVKHIINRHNGMLDITSEIGEGSTFKVILPSEQNLDVA